ncbi:MAG: STAS domain-containing protein [Solirubrobacteraceae bacterium]
MRERTNPATTTTLGDVAVVAISGELDLALCVKVAPDLNAVLHSAAKAVVVDLEDVSLIDSSGIALLLNAFRRLDQDGRRLAIACPRAQRRVFELTALDRQLPMYETGSDALAAVQAG